MPGQCFDPFAPSFRLGPSTQCWNLVLLNLVLANTNTNYTNTKFSTTTCSISKAVLHTNYTVLNLVCSILYTTFYYVIL